ncbi:SDR family oxidoreductase [Shouchella clausii]|uniref:SDR family oxidoreductase n=1 Tax=Shouchella clausii TaxID=79880 RepID=UPI00280AA9EE|nr:SDR family NAD(P)-dependent oxidoreductase [Shouchella clausii]WMM30874.1 SDR family NAD(P)-dependent oxidoreductase [Shouchella clausii]
MSQKTAVITGAASGIGRATAMAFAKEGTTLVLIDQDEQRLKTLKAELDKEHVYCFQADISDAKRMETVFNEIGETVKTIDIVFANAGINGTVTSIEAFEPEDWEQTVQVNLTGTFLSVKYAIPLMKKQGGSIMMTSSVNGTRVFSNFGMSAYSASKAGIAAFAKMAALELANYGIRVNVICPGAIRTHIDERTYRHEEALKPITIHKNSEPFPTPPGTPEQVADTVLYLASDGAKHISGAEIVIDGAQTLL